MPKASKHTTSVTGKSQSRPIHPYSRKALKLGKQILHGKRLEASKSSQTMRSELLTEKLCWFQDHLDDRPVYTKQELIDLIEQYRNRFKEELEQIGIICGVGSRQGQSKQHAAREASIKITEEEETNQFEGSGIEVPDIINKKHLQAFRAWNGEFKFVQNLKLRKISFLDVERLKKNEKVLLEDDISKEQDELHEDN